MSMSSIHIGLSPCKEKIVKNTFVRMHELYVLKIILLTTCMCFPSVSFCEERAKSYDEMNKKGVLSEPNKTIVPESVPQERFIKSSDCIEYKRNIQTIDDKNEVDISISTVIKIFSLLLAFLMALFTAFSIFIGFTSWKTQSSYKEEVARAKEAADKAENVLKDIGIKGEVAIKEFEKRTKEISKSEKSGFEAFAKFVSITTTLEDYLSRGKELADELSTTKDINVIPDERDFLKLTLVHLKKLPEKLNADENILYKGTFDKLLKDARDIKACLKRVQYKGEVQDLTDACDEIIKILETLTAKSGNST